MARQQVSIDRPQDGHVLDRIGKGQGDRIEARGPIEGGRAPALAEQALRHKDGDPRGQEIERHARDQLIAPEGDRGNPVEGGQQHRGDDPRPKTQPDRACQRRHRARGHGGHQHLAFQPDVENAGTFRKKARQTGQQQRCGQPQRGVENLDERCEIHYAAFGLRKRNSQTSSIRTIWSSAPVNRITSPCTTMRSSIGIDVHRPSSAPP